MTIKIHELKTWPDEFRAIEKGWKRAEYRLNDRNFQTFDVLHLREWLPPGWDTEKQTNYTGNELLVKVTHVQRQFMPEGYVMLSIELLGDTA